MTSFFQFFHNPDLRLFYTFRLPEKLLLIWDYLSGQMSGWGGICANEIASIFIVTFHKSVLIRLTVLENVYLKLYKLKG